MTDHLERAKDANTNLEYVKTWTMIAIVTGIGVLIWQNFFAEEPYASLKEALLWRYTNESAIHAIEAEYGVHVEPGSIHPDFCVLTVTPVGETDNATVLEAMLRLAELHPPVDLRSQSH